MERIFLVENDNFKEVRKYLDKGAHVRFIQPVPEMVSITGDDYNNTIVGDVYAYVVIEYDPDLMK